MIPERELWVCVILQAIDDLHGHNGCESARYRSIRSLEAKNWFQFEAQSVGSFLWICGQLNLETTMSPFHATFETILNNLDNPSK